MAQDFNSSLSFCRDAFTYWPGSTSIEPPAAPGLLLFIIGLLEFLAFLFLIIHLRRQSKLAKQQEESASFSPHHPQHYQLRSDGMFENTLIFPLYNRILYVCALAALYDGLVNVLFPVQISRTNSIFYSVMFALAWALNHFVVEGISFLLCQYGVGSRAGKRAFMMASIWFVLTFISAGMEFYHQDRLGTLASLVWNVPLALFYLCLWLAPTRLFFRRPSVFPYAAFWSINRILVLISVVLRYFNMNVGFCIYELSTEGVLSCVVPYVVYQVLLRDCKYWQGLLDLNVKKRYMIADLNTNRVNESIRQPLLGTSLDPSSAREIAARMDLNNNNNSNNNNNNNPPYISSSSTSSSFPIVVPILNFAFLSIDHLSSDYSSNRESHVVLGAGSSSRVFRGTFRSRPVAIKMIFCPELTPETIATFYHEATLLANLRCENVVGVMGVCVLPPSICLVMEYMNEGNLFEFLRMEGIKKREGREKEMKMTPKLRLQFAYDCCKAISFLHNRNPPVLHLDIKSSNFLIKRNESNSGRKKKKRGDRGKEERENECEWIVKIADLELSREIVIAEDNKTRIRNSFVSTVTVPSTTHSTTQTVLSEAAAKAAAFASSSSFSSSSFHFPAFSSSSTVRTAATLPPPSSSSLLPPLSSSFGPRAPRPSLSSAPSFLDVPPPRPSTVSSHHVVHGSELSGYRLPETIYWSAPEVLCGLSYSEKADVYSLAMVIWEIYTGEVPYKRLEDELSNPVFIDMKAGQRGGGAGGQGVDYRSSHSHGAVYSNSNSPLTSPRGSYRQLITPNRQLPTKPMAIPVNPHSLLHQQQQQQQQQQQYQRTPPIVGGFHSPSSQQPSLQYQQPAIQRQQPHYNPAATSSVTGSIRSTSSHPFNESTAANKALLLPSTITATPANDSGTPHLRQVSSDPQLHHLDESINSRSAATSIGTEMRTNGSQSSGSSNHSRDASVSNSLPHSSSTASGHSTPHESDSENGENACEGMVPSNSFPNAAGGAGGRGGHFSNSSTLCVPPASRKRTESVHHPAAPIPSHLSVTITSASDSLLSIPPYIPTPASSSSFHPLSSTNRAYTENLPHVQPVIVSQNQLITEQRRHSDVGSRENFPSSQPIPPAGTVTTTSAVTTPSGPVPAELDVTFSTTHLLPPPFSSSNDRIPRLQIVKSFRKSKSKKELERLEKLQSKLERKKKKHISQQQQLLQQQEQQEVMGEEKKIEYEPATVTRLGSETLTFNDGSPIVGAALPPVLSSSSLSSVHPLSSSLPPPLVPLSSSSSVPSSSSAGRPSSAYFVNKNELTEQLKHLICLEYYRPSIPADMPRSLAMLIQRSWSADPTTRPNAQELVDCIRQLLHEEREKNSGEKGNLQDEFKFAN